jgi:hypothetical protein
VRAVTTKNHAEPVDARTTPHTFVEQDEDDLCRSCRGTPDDPIHLDEDETVEAPTLSMHAETGTECSPAAPCGTCQQRAAGAPVAGAEKTCGCHGLGLAVVYNDSMTDPQFNVVPCEDHPLRTDQTNSVDALEAAACRVDEILEAVAAVRDIIAGAECGSALDRYMLIRDKLAFIKPTWK